jgi:hypothetical protein
MQMLKPPYRPMLLPILNKLNLACVQSKNHSANPILIKQVKNQYLYGRKC